MAMHQTQLIDFSLYGYAPNAAHKFTHARIQYSMARFLKAHVKKKHIMARHLMQLMTKHFFFFFYFYSTITFPGLDRQCDIL